jgi:nucleoside-diphosphate-sugar epimerase
MSIALITGSVGLIGSETTKWFHQSGLDVVGIDNNLGTGHRSRDWWLRAGDTQVVTPQNGEGMFQVD